MPNFYRFKTATIKKSNIEEIQELYQLGLNPEVEVELEYRELPIRLEHISYYYPLKATKLSKEIDEADLLDDDEVWEHATYINVILIDGTEFTVQHDIKDFIEILEQ